MKLSSQHSWKLCEHVYGAPVAFLINESLAWLNKLF
jgi:hypothetical protein